MFIQPRARETRRLLFLDDLLPLPRTQLLELLGQFRPGREDGCAVGDLVDDVDDVFGLAGRAPLLEEGGDGFAGRFDGFSLQVALGVFVLGVDYCCDRWSIGQGLFWGIR